MQVACCGQHQVAQLTPETPADRVTGDGPSAWKVKREAGEMFSMPALPPQL
jgi:hypothetical protein